MEDKSISVADTLPNEPVEVEEPLILPVEVILPPWTSPLELTAEPVMTANCTFASVVRSWFTVELDSIVIVFKPLVVFWPKVVP